MESLAPVLYIVTNDPLVFKKIKKLKHSLFVFRLCSSEVTVLFL